MSRTRKRALWLASEAGSYSTDPSANGSGYVHVPVMAGTLTFRDQLTLIDTDQHVDSNFPTKPLAGPDGWQLDAEVPLSGLSAAAGDGTNASTVTDDYLDIIMAHITTSAVTTPGEGLAGSSTTTTIILDTDAYNAQHLAPIYESGLPAAAPRTQWAMINIDGGATYTGCTPTLDDAPTTAAVAYGTKAYIPSVAGGNSLALVYRSPTADYTLLGGRVTAATIVGELDGVWRLRLTIQGDRIVRESKGSLPAIAVFSRFLKVQLSPVWFGGTKYATNRIEIDLGITAAEIGSTAATNGRANYDSIAIVPSVTISPLFTTALEDLKRNVTAGELLVQMGGGVLANSVLNTCAFHILEATARGNDDADDGGRQRISLPFQTSTPLLHSSGAAARVWQFVRA